MTTTGRPGGEWVQVGDRRDWVPAEQPPSPDGSPGRWHVVTGSDGAHRWEWHEQAMHAQNISGQREGGGWRSAFADDYEADVGAEERRQRMYDAEARSAALAEEVRARNGDGLGPPGGGPPAHGGGPPGPVPVPVWNPDGLPGARDPRWNPWRAAARPFVVAMTLTIALYTVILTIAGVTGLYYASRDDSQASSQTGGGAESFGMVELLVVLVALLVIAIAVLVLVGLFRLWLLAWRITTPVHPGHDPVLPDIDWRTV